MRTLRHLRNQFLHNDKHHGPCGKSEEIRHHRRNQSGCQDRHRRRGRLHCAGQDARQESFAFLHSFCQQRHGDNCSFREILDSDPKRQRECARRRDSGRTGQQPGIDHADGHSFRDIVKRNGKDQLCRTFEGTPRAFILPVHMHVRCDHIQRQQEPDTGQESDSRRQRSQRSHPGAAVQRRLQQAPERCGNHDACRKSGQCFPDSSGKLLFQEKDHRCPETGAQERDQNPFSNLQIHQCHTPMCRFLCLRDLSADRVR